VSSWLDVLWVVDNSLYTQETVEHEKFSTVAVVDTNQCAWYLLPYPFQRHLNHLSCPFSLWMVHIHNPCLTIRSVYITEREVVLNILSILYITHWPIPLFWHRSTIHHRDPLRIPHPSSTFFTASIYDTFCTPLTLATSTCLSRTGHLWSKDTWAPYSWHTPFFPLNYSSVPCPSAHFPHFGISLLHTAATCP
jgi:hypothetical protein